MHSKTRIFEFLGSLRESRRDPGGSGGSTGEAAPWGLSRSQLLFVLKICKKTSTAHTRSSAALNAHFREHHVWEINNLSFLFAFPTPLPVHHHPFPQSCKPAPTDPAVLWGCSHDCKSHPRIKAAHKNTPITPNTHGLHGPGEPGTPTGGGGTGSTAGTPHTLGHPPACSPLIYAEPQRTPRVSLHEGRRGCPPSRDPPLPPLLPGSRRSSAPPSPGWDIPSLRASAFVCGADTEPTSAGRLCPPGSAGDESRGSRRGTEKSGRRLPARCRRSVRPAPPHARSRPGRA